MEPRKFVPHNYQCQDCGDVFHSSYSGEYISCKCGKSAVDETLWYTRCIGNCMLIAEYE